MEKSPNALLHAHAQLPHTLPCCTAIEFMCMCCVWDQYAVVNENPEMLCLLSISRHNSPWLILLNLNEHYNLLQYSMAYIM